MTGESGAAITAAARPGPARLAKFGLPVLLVVSLAARLWYSSVSPLSYDETHNLMIGMLANQGHAPYREIYSVIMPFAVLTMQISAAIWGATAHVRLLMIAYGLMGVAALYFLVYRHSRSYAALAALFAGTFLSFNPHYFFVSTSINLEAGALAWGLLSVALVEQYRTRSGVPNRSSGRLLWLLLAGVAFGLSATFKVFVPFLPAIVALQLLLVLTVARGESPRRPSTYWHLLRLGIVWAAGVVLTLIVFLLAFDRAALMEQVLASRFALREAIDTDTMDVNIAEALSAADLVQYIPLLIGAIVGVFALRRQRLVQAWIWPAWFVLAGLFLLTHDPVRPRHTVMILPSLAALSGIGLAYLLKVVAMRRPQVAHWLNPVMATVLLVLAVLAPLPYADTESFTDRHPVRQAAIDYVQQASAPQDCIISKENRLHFLAGRLSTPHLSLISTARLFSGLLPATDIAREADLHDCPVLVYADTFDRLIPDLRNELNDVYALRLTLVDPREPDYPLDVYAVQLDTAREPDHAADLRLGERIAFLGYSQTPGPWQPGQTVQLTTYWQAQEPVNTDYKLFVHLLDEQGNLIQPYDHYPIPLDPHLPVQDIVLNPIYLTDRQSLPEHYPATGMVPTSLWRPGSTLVETFTLPLPPDLAPSIYSFALGMYDELSMQRLHLTGLPLESEQTEANQILLEPVPVEAAKAR